MACESSAGHFFCGWDRMLDNRCGTAAREKLTQAGLKRAGAETFITRGDSMDSSTVLLNPDDVLVHPKNWTEIPSHVAHLYSAQHPVVAVYTIQGRQHAVLVGAGWASERACSYLDAPGTKFYKQIINPKCSKPIMQPQYTKIFGQLGRDLSVEPLFLMAIALQESGWDLVHVFGTNSSSKG